MKTTKALKPLTPALALAIVLVLPAGVSAQQPQIELFPSTVIEDLREAGQAAEAFETDMMPAITALQNEMAEYDKLNCRGAVSDSGCMQAERLLGNAYSKFLDSLNEHIPEMLNSMENIKETQGSSISRQIGRGLTPRQLEELISTSGAGVVDDQAEIILKGAGFKGRMSQRFEDYRKLVSSQAVNQQQGGAVLAMINYLDAHSSATQLKALQSDLLRQQTELNLPGAWGAPPSDQIMATVSSVQAVLFGESTQNIDPPTGDSEEEFDDSRLRFD